jgi:hypothetical protein
MDTQTTLGIQKTSLTTRAGWNRLSTRNQRQRVWPALSVWLLTACVGMLLLTAPAVQAANFSSVQSGAWDDTATWGAASFPGPSDNVTINTGHSVNVATTEAALNLTLVSGSGLQINAFQTMTVNGDITVNSTAVLGGGTASSLRFNGATFTNNGTVSEPEVDFNRNGAQSIAGTGAWTGSFLNIGISASGNASNTSLSGPQTFGVGTLTVVSGNTLTVNNGLTTTTANITNHGTLSLNSTLSFNPPQGSMRIFENTATVSGAGTFQAQGDIEIDNTGSFSAPLSVSSSGGSLTRVNGVPTTFDGPITVASGATLQIDAFQVLVTNGDVTVNSTGTLTGQGSSTLRFNGATLTNNGTISAPTVEFNASGAQTLTGAGAISSNTVVNNGSTVTLGSDHQLSSLTINGGGALNITSRTLSVSGGGTPLTNNGTMTTTGSTVVYNGSSPQDMTSSFVFNNLTINNTAGVSLSDEQVNGALTLTAGALSVGAHTLTLNGAIINSAGSLTGGGTSNITFGGAGANTTLPAVQSGLGNLSINRALGISLGADLLVSSSLSLTLGDLTTGASTLIMPGGATSNGTTDVVGNVLRPGFVSGTTFSFGNPDNQITITSDPATSPTSILVNLAKSIPIGFPFAVQRNYTISPTGGVGAFTATVRLHYLVAELNGNTETSLKLFRFNGTTWVPYPPTTPVNTTNHWVENNAVQDFSPWTLGTSAPTATNGIVTGRIVDDHGNPVEGAVVKLEGTQNRKFITDANGVYHFDDVETNGFYTVTPSRVNYTFSPTSRSFSQIGQTTNAVFSASATGQTANPLDTPEYFVRQHYIDFLGREPDEAGFNFWSDQIIECGGDTNCIERRRENVSAAYFLAIEFQQTGGLVDGLYRASYGTRPQFAEFMPDTRTVGLGVVVGKEGWEAKLLANRKAFVAAFVNRPAFHTTYDAMDDSLFVDTLIGHTGVSFTAAERDALVNGLWTGTMTRGDVLRNISENGRFVNAKLNETFVMMEYFGYLRRDADPSGFAFWLNKLNEFNGNFEQAEMVKAFIVSAEYRSRFAR